MVPAAARLLQVMFVTMFCISTLGNQMFGGLINYGPQYAILNTTSFGDSNYYANNFNDYMSGLVVCFELLVVNNWFITCEGFAAVSPMPVARLYFVLVYVIGVLVAMNIVIAFAIDSYNEVLKRKIEKMDGEKKLDAQSEYNGEDDVAAAEFRADRHSIAQREHSASILEAQQRLHAYVPTHSPNYNKVQDLLQATKRQGSPEKVGPRSGGATSYSNV